MIDNQRRRANTNSESEMDYSKMPRELGQLLDVLLAAHEELSEGMMPRAARITGTGQRLAHVISCVETAVCTTQNLLAAHERRATRAYPDGAGGDMPSPDVVTCIDYLSEGRQNAAASRSPG